MFQNEVLMERLGDPIGSMYGKICRAVFVCPSCGATVQGRDLLVATGYRNNFDSPIHADFPCPTCGQWMEYLYD